MEISFHRPCPRLQPYIRYFWILKTDAAHEVLTFPIGCPQLIFHRGATFYIPELESSQYRFTISGQVNFPARIRSSGYTETIAAVLKPHALAAAFDIPVSSFYNQEIDGYALEDKSLNTLADRILNDDSSDNAVAMIEQWLLDRVSGHDLYRFNRLDTPLKHLFSTRSASVEEMSRYACLSRKQFERTFFDAVGMMPKEYSCIVRFQRSLWLMQNGRLDFADVSHSCGYSDQSHFIRECRKFSSLTPAELLKTQPIYSDLFSSPF